MSENATDTSSEAPVVAQDAPATAQDAPATAQDAPAVAQETPALAEDGAALVGTTKNTAFSSEEIARITDEIIAAIKTVYDPEIPVDIYELGLIYKVDLEEDRTVKIDMTLTAPGCPVAGEMPVWVDNAVRSVEGIADVEVAMVFDPPWDPSRMSEEAQVALNWW